MKPSLGIQALRGGFHQYLAILAQIVAQIVVLAVLSRILTAEDFGAAALAMVVVSFATSIAEFGLAQGLIRSPSLDGRLISTAYWSSVASGTLICILLASLADQIAALLGHATIAPLIATLSISFLIVSTASTAEAILVRSLNFRALLVASSLAQLGAYTVVSIAMALAGFGVWSLVAGSLAQFSTRSLLIILMAPHTRSLNFDGAAFRELMHFGGGITLARLFNFVAISADQVIIGRALGIEQLGLYTRAMQIIRAPMVLLGTTTERVSYPLMAKVGGEADKLREVFLMGVTLAAALALPSGVLFYMAAQDIVTLLVGSEWQESIRVLQILSIAVVPRIIYKLSDGLAKARGAVYQRSARESLYAVFVVVFVSVGSIARGIDGAAWGVAAATFTNWLVCAHLSRGMADFTWLDYCKSLLPAIGPAIVVGAACWTTGHISGDGILGAGIRTGLALLVALSCFLVVYLLFPGLLGHRLQRIAAVASDSFGARSRMLGAALRRMGARTTP